jgi:hypothetical protein
LLKFSRKQYGIYNDTDPHIGVLAAFYFGVKVPNSSKQFFQNSTGSTYYRFLSTCGKKFTKSPVFASIVCWKCAFEVSISMLKTLMSGKLFVEHFF